MRRPARSSSVDNRKQDLPSGAVDFDAELAVLADSAVFYHRSREAAAAGSTPEELVGKAFERAAAIADEAERGAKAKHVTACRKGCAWCCHQNVLVSAAEVFYLARWLRTHLSAGDLLALTEHAQASATQLRGRRSEERRVGKECRL